MPELSRFLGIIISMNFNDHPPPHFHAAYNEFEATFDISRLEMLAGNLPPRATRFTLEWAQLHQQELLDNWNSLQALGSWKRIAPLE